MVFGAEISITFIPTRISLAIWKFRFEYAFSFFESAFEFRLSGNGRFEEKVWDFGQNVLLQWMEYNSLFEFPMHLFRFRWNMCLTQKLMSFIFFSTLMPHNSSCFVFDWSPTFFLSSGYKIRWTFEMPLHTFIDDQQPVSTLASWFRWFQMIARFMKRSPAQHFFSLVVFEKLSRSVSTKLNWFPCTSWSILVQLTLSN